MGFGQEGWPDCSFQPSLRLEGKNLSPQPGVKKWGDHGMTRGLLCPGSADIWQPSSQ